MYGPIRIVVRCLVIVAVVTATAVAIAPPSPSGSPYLSALSDLAATPASAKPRGCARVCQVGSPSTVCIDGAGTKCSFHAGNCITVTC